MNKGQLSIEYILLAAAATGLLFTIITTANILYSKNIQKIDDRELEYASNKLQDTINTIQYMPQAKEIIRVYPQKEWILKSNSYSKDIILKNTNKEKLIKSTFDIYISNHKINQKSDIIITKIDNKIYLEIKKAN